MLLNFNFTLDVQNMIHWSQTSTLSLELFIIVDGMAAGTVAVMEVAVEVTPGIPGPLSVQEGNILKHSEIL